MGSGSCGNVIAALATSVCTENVIGTKGIGTTNSGVEFAVPGIKRSM